MTQHEVAMSEVPGLPVVTLPGVDGREAKIVIAIKTIGVSEFSNEFARESMSSHLHQQQGSERKTSSGFVRWPGRGLCPSRVTR